MYVRPTNSGLGQIPGSQLIGAVSGSIGNWLGNVFGSHNRPAIQDIEAGLAMGETISAASWADAGLPPDGGEWYRNYKIQHGIMSADMLNPANMPGMASAALGGLSLSNPLVLGALALGAFFIIKRL